MSVFMRRGGAVSAKKTKWAKYTISYTGTKTEVKVAYGTGTTTTAAKAATTTVTYYDSLSFAADGTAGGLGSNTVTVSGSFATNADKMNGKIFQNGNYFYYILNNAATYNTYKQSTNQYGCNVYKQSYGAMTAETAKSFTAAGTYVEDVESEDENAYPDNGPLGTYYYIKQ